MSTDTPVQSVRQSFVRFWPDTRPLRVRWALSLALVAVAPALSTAAIWLFKILIDRVVVPHNFHFFPQLAAAYFGLAVVQGAVSFTDQYLSTWVGEKFVVSLRTQLFNHLHVLEPGFLERRQLGDVLSRLTGDIGAIEELVLSGIAQGLTYLCQLVWFTAALFILDWRLACASVIAAPAFLAITRVFSLRIKELSREKRRRAGSITTVAEESLSNAPLVRAYNHRDQENARFLAQVQGSFNAQMATARLQALFGPLTDLLEVLGVLLVIGLAVWELAHGRISIGGLLAFVALLTQLYSPIQGASRLTSSLYAASASAERVIELLDEVPSVPVSSDPTALPRARGELRLQGVSFTYPGLAEPALSEIDLRIEPGKTIALVGASGAGKSTLAKLLLRFEDPNCGTVAIDGVDLRDLSFDDLYRNVSTVLQETLVFDATIRDNILWGRPEATESDVIVAAEAAGAHEFIDTLPQRYDTRVGQRGRMLSGGQRQRLAIARALIRDSPILILDEPTTGLDADTTRRVLTPLRTLMAGRTTVIISHNLLTVTDADRIVFLEHGRITAQGSHAELLDGSPAYAALYRLHHDLDTSHDEETREPAGMTGQRGPSSGHPSCRGPLIGHELTANQLWYRYPGQRVAAMPGVTLAVAPGRCLAVIGDTGSGKSTLIRLLAGLQRPSHGTIHVGELDLADAIAQGLRIRLLAGHPERAEGTMIDDISAALRDDPDLLLLDEPTLGLDDQAHADLLDILHTATRDRIMVVSTRDPKLAALADHRLWMDTPALRTGGPIAPGPTRSHPHITASRSAIGVSRT